LEFSIGREAKTGRVEESTDQETAGKYQAGFTAITESRRSCYQGQEEMRARNDT